MGETPVNSINPLGIAFTLLAGMLLLVLPRRRALWPIALITCYMTFGQRLDVVGLDFTMLRLMVLFGMARVVMRSEYRAFQWLRLDTLVIAFVCVGVVAYTLLWQTGGALINRLGVAYDALGLYFLFRCIVRDAEDIKAASRIFALTLFPLAVCMCLERGTGRNAFYMFGGVPEFTKIREGTLRCQGPFAHPILAGTFGAIWLPLFVGLWRQGRGNRTVAAIGAMSSVLIALTSGSSGPLATLAVGAGAVCASFMRPYMRAFRWSIVLGLLLLQLAMRDPVWFIFARINIISASAGWHRSHLIDKTIRNFFDWCFVGVKDTGRWGIWSTHGHGDVTNQYIRHGVDGGFLALVLFIAIIVWCFSRLGRKMRRARFERPAYRALLWATGSTMFAHVLSFFSIAYFDQNVVNWYLLLAMTAGVVTAPMPSETAYRTPQEPEVAVPVREAYATAFR